MITSSGNCATCPAYTLPSADRFACVKPACPANHVIGQLGSCLPCPAGTVKKVGQNVCVRRTVVRVVRVIRKGPHVAFMDEAQEQPLEDGMVELELNEDEEDTDTQEVEEEVPVEEDVNEEDVVESLGDDITELSELDEQELIDDVKVEDAEEESDVIELKPTEPVTPAKLQ